MPSAGYNYHNC